MKKFALAAVLAAAASTSFAGGLEEPVMEEMPTMDTSMESSSSGMGWVIPVLLLAVVAAVAAS